MRGLPKRIIETSVAVARVYNRIEITHRADRPTGPVLFVANHGFGGIVDLNILAFAAAYQELGDERDVVSLTHAMVWKLGLGGIIEMFDARPAGKDAALEALADGHHVLVFPGGDIDALKSWTDRNKVLFSGRAGFARLAMNAGVPIIPVVTAGAGESLYVFSSGKRIARLSGVQNLLRLNALPVSFSIPWGLSVGFTGLLPYLPLPTKLTTTVLPAMVPHNGDTAEDFAERVHKTMQDELTALTAHRKPVIG